MDEPLSALDAALRAQLRTELRSLITELGVTTVYVTHDQAEAMSMSDRIVVLRAGRVLQHGRPEELYYKPADTFVAEFVGVFNSLPGAAGGVRAERVRILAPDETAPVGHLVVTATVRSAVFTGGSYEVACEVPGVARLWTVPGQRAYTAGTELRLTLANDDVITPAA
jgi:ABC-type Fe3+/spermidine/putrescine transport system ATPase subunit